MMGTINCCYETPCGWCSRFDKKCERSSMRRPKVHHSENDWEHCVFLDNGKCWKDYPYLDNSESVEEFDTENIDLCQKEKCEHVKLKGMV